MSVEQEVSPNIYPSAESVKLEPIAILTPREGVRRVLFQTQALLLQAILRSLKDRSLDGATFSSEGLHEDIWPGRPYQSGVVTQTMIRLIPHIDELGGTITAHPSEADRHLRYDVYLPEDVRTKIQIEMRKVPAGVTFHLPNGKISTGEKTAVLHELMIDHLTAESAIPVNELWKLVRGDMPYNVTLMSRLLRGVQQDLEETGILVEIVTNYRKMVARGFVHSHNLVFLNASGYIERLKAETEKLQASGLPQVEEAAEELSYPASSYKAAKKVTEISFANFSHARQLADHVLRTLLYRHVFAVSAQYFPDRVSFTMDREEFIAFGLIAQKYAQSLSVHPQAQQFLQERQPYLLTQSDLNTLGKFVDPAAFVGAIEVMLRRTGYHQIAEALKQPKQHKEEIPDLKQSIKLEEDQYYHPDYRVIKISKRDKDNYAPVSDLKATNLILNVNLEELEGWDLDRLRQLYNTVKELGSQRSTDEVRYSDLGLVVHPIHHGHVSKFVTAENQQVVTEACQFILHVYQAKQNQRPIQPLPDEKTIPTYRRIYNAVELTLGVYNHHQKLYQEKNPGKPFNMRIFILGFLRYVTSI